MIEGRGEEREGRRVRSRMGFESYGRCPSSGGSVAERCHGPVSPGVLCLPHPTRAFLTQIGVTWVACTSTDPDPAVQRHIANPNITLPAVSALCYEIELYLPASSLKRPLSHRTISPSAPQLSSSHILPSHLAIVAQNHGRNKFSPVERQQIG